jgi:PIN domain nuclease of toxin-antitoxin system
MKSDRLVLDASAVLALLHGEPGADAVAMILQVSLVSAVNWSEVVQKSWSHGVGVAGLQDDLESLGVELVPFGAPEALAAADLWHRGARALALADRACLATAAVRGLPVVTADRAWAALELDLEVRVIR